MPKLHKHINMKKLHCKHCGGVTHLSNKVDGYLELKPEQMSPWRCEHCGAVYEFNKEGDPDSGYKMVRNPQDEIDQQAALQAEQERQKFHQLPNRDARRAAKRKRGKSKLRLFKRRKK